jgi:hypothetical protein
MKKMYETVMKNDDGKNINLPDITAFGQNFLSMML